MSVGAFFERPRIAKIFAQINEKDSLKASSKVEKTDFSFPDGYDEEKVQDMMDIRWGYEARYQSRQRNLDLLTSGQNDEDDAEIAQYLHD